MSWKPNRHIEKQINKRLEKALLLSAEVLRDKAKSNAPVDTGELQRSIDIDISDVRDLGVAVGSTVKYANIVEFGTKNKSPNPFLRSALKESTNKMLKKFKGILNR